ncbi:MAG: ABC transporter permease [Ilumatobacteraceae bacterium]|nr:ABC transporter permease [Ilumatobacteraceae bacterium]
MSTAIQPASPTSLQLGLGRTVVEMKNLLRNRQYFGFTVLFPVMMLLLFASIFTGTIDGTGVETSQVYVAGIIGSSLMSTALVGLAIGIAIERDAGLLKRLAGTPMPKVAYFLGKIGMVLIVSLVQSAVMLALGVSFFSVSLPRTFDAWLTFGWVFLLGVTACTLLGISAGSIIRDAKSAPAVMNLPFVALQFISGVFITVDQLPAWVVKVSQVFPLHWICRGMRSVFVPDSFKVVESGGSWQLGTAAVVLAVWCVVGFFVCVRSFRWTRG